MKTIHADGTITTPSPFPAGVPVGTKGITPIELPDHTDENYDFNLAMLQADNQEDYLTKHNLPFEVLLEGEVA